MAESVRKRASGKRAIAKRKRSIKGSRFWTTKQASDWSGMKYRLTLRLVKRGVIPGLGIEPDGQQTTPDGKPVRRFFLIPKAAFIRWFESIGSDPKRVA
jgi:hypothetical protein